MLRIMLADDYLPDVVLVKEALHAHGIQFDMDVCANGEAALQYVTDSATPERKPRLFILDLNLSRVDGLEILQAIRAQSAFNGTPVAVLTSSLSLRVRTQALELGADAFLTKPTGLEEFLSGVGTVLCKLLTSYSGDDAIHERST